MSLLDRLPEAGSGLPAWIPDDEGEGAVIEGTIKSLSYQESDYQEGVMIPILVLDISPKVTEDGDSLIGLRGYDSIFRNEFEKTGAKVGWRLAVRYDGKVAKKKGKFAGKMMRSFTMLAEEPSLAGKMPAAGDEPPF